MKMADLLKQYRLLLSASLAFALLLSALLLWIGNQKAFQLVNEFVTPKFGLPAIALSLLGESAAMGILLILSLWLEIRKTIFVFIVWFTGACFSWMFKLWLCKGLERPFAYYSSKGVVLNMVEGVNVHHFNTFPSGHTLTAFSAAFLLVYLFPKLPKVGQLFVFLLAAGCGMSRVILVQHWPFDILGGMVLGIFAFFSGLGLLRLLPDRKVLDKTSIGLLLGPTKRVKS
jgi:membrane-associated phospholipid phosphatase